MSRVCMSDVLPNVTEHVLPNVTEHVLPNVTEYVRLHSLTYSYGVIQVHERIYIYIYI